MKIKPFDTTLIVEVEKTKDKTDGGIVLPSEMVSRDQMNVSEGVLVSCGSYAFSEVKQLDDAEYPKSGDKVFFKKHSGILYNDKETDKQYRFINDVDIYAFERKEVSNG